MFSSMKYSELQKLAKENGIKANQKSEKLIIALKSYFDHHEHDDEAGKIDMASSEPDPNPQQLKPENTTKKISKSVEIRNLKSSICEKSSPHILTVEDSTSRKKQKRKRKSTYELDIPTLPDSPNISVNKANKNPETEVEDVEINFNHNICQRTKRKSIFEVIPDEHEDEVTFDIKATSRFKRRSIFETDKLKVRNNSQHKENEEKKDSLNNSGIDDMLKALDSSDNNNSKDKLMKILDDRAKTKLSKTSSSIPRFVAYADKLKKIESKNEPKPKVTPGSKNWQKIHQSEFNKMESLDDYSKRKRIRSETLASGKKLPLNSLNVSKQKKSAESTQRKLQKSPEKEIKKSNMAVVTPFSVKMSEQQTKSTYDFGAKAEDSRVFVFSANKKQNKTPLGSLNNTLQNSTRTFDLQASLSKKPTWVPHKGKLAPFQMDNVYKVGSENSCKNVKIQPRSRRVHPSKAQSFCI